MTQKSAYGKMRKLIIMLITGLLILVISFLVVRFMALTKHQSNAHLGTQQANEKVYPDEFYFNDDSLVTTKGNNYQIPNDVYKHYQVFKIRSAECLKRFANIVSTSNIHSSSVYDSFLGKTVVLTADINYGKAFPKNKEINIGDHTSIGANHIFQGDFEGNNHTISNFEIGNHYYFSDYAQHCIGLFTYFGGTLQNLTITDLTCGNIGYHGDAVASGLVGYLAESAKIVNCNISNFLITKGYYRSGLVGVAVGSSQISHCQVLNIEANTSDSHHCDSSAGLLFSDNGINVSVVDCKVINFKSTPQRSSAGLIHIVRGSNPLIQRCQVLNVELNAWQVAGLIGYCSTVYRAVTLNISQCAVDNFKISYASDSVNAAPLINVCSLDGASDLNVNVKDVYIRSESKLNDVMIGPFSCTYNNNYKPGALGISCENIVIRLPNSSVPLASQGEDFMTFQFTNCVTNKNSKDGFDWSSEGGDLSSTIWYWGGDEYNDGWMYLRDFIEWKELKFESSDKEVGTVNPASIQVPVEYKAPASLPARSNVWVLKRAIKVDIKQVGYIVSKWLFDEKDTFIVYFSREYGALKVIASMSNYSNVQYLSNSSQFNIDDVYHVARGSVVNINFISTVKKKTDYVQSEKVNLYDQIKISFVAFDRIKQSDGSYLYNNERTIEAIITLSEAGYIFYKQDNLQEKLTDVKGSSINIITLPSIMLKTYNVTIQ